MRDIKGGKDMASTALKSTQKVSKEKIINLAKLAGSVKLTEHDDISDIIRDIRGK